MRRVRFVSAVLAVASAALVLGSAQFRTSAQNSTPTSGNSGFVGSWRLTFDTPLGPSQSLITLMADGTVLFSGRPVSPADGGFPVIFSSAGHGVWQQTGATTAEITWVGLVTDGEGNFLATVTDTAHASLDVGGNAWSGPYSATVVDPSGTELYVGGGTVRAERITVQPLAMPAPGTPTAS